MPLVYGQDERVTRWVAAANGHSEPPPATSAIGFERGGDLVAGVFFDNCSKTNVFAHIACSALVMPVELLAATAAYAFVQIGALRMTFLVNDDNTACRALVIGLGAQREGRLEKGHEKGDVLIYVLWRDSRFYQRLVQTGRVVPIEEAA